MSKNFPPLLGTKADEALKYNPYQISFLNAHRARVCPTCKQLVPSRSDGSIHCAMCDRVVLKPRRAFNRFGLFAGRRGGKTKIGAVGAVQEIQIPDTNGIVAAPSYPKLFELDSTFDTLISRIPYSWVADWDSEYYDLTLVNGARIGFRSFEDPQRARGGKAHWMWMDEGREIAEEAWDTAEPSLTEEDGICILTTSPRGEDWCFERFWQPVYREKRPGYWAIKWKTAENPTIPQRVIDARRRDTDSKMFKQEYEADFVTFEGAIYEELGARHYLADDDAIREKIPEWPKIDPSRRLLVGLDSGADHPFGAPLAVITEKGIVWIAEYLQRDTALAVHKIRLHEMVNRWGGSQSVHWASNKNERQMMIEFAQHPNPIPVIAAENDQWAGIQRVNSWIHTNRMFFAYTVPQTWAQMKSYHMAPNILKSGEKREKEKVYKKKDELPDGIRYALMSWPELPTAFEPVNERDITALPWEVKKDIERMREIAKAQKGNEDGLEPMDEGYPLQEFFH